ncbi:MAG: hypothetical protein WCF03_15275 [Nitrososphaeraceae archaeon]
MTNSDENDAQNEQTPRILMLIAHKKKRLIYQHTSIKPSEPSVIYVGKQKGIPSRFFLTELMKSLLDCSVLSSNQNVMVTGDNR